MGKNIMRIISISTFKNNRISFLRWRWLIGINQIANYADYNVADIMNFIFNWFDFPAQKIKPQGIWIARKRDVRKWFKKFNPVKTTIPHYSISNKPKQQINKKLLKTRRW